MTEDPSTPLLQAHVALPVSLRTPLTYRVPPDLEAEIRIGHRVLVPLASRRLNGYVLDLVRGEPEQPLKPLLAILDPVALFPEEMVPFYRWIADYYVYPIGMVIQSALPSGLSIRSRKAVRLTCRGLRARESGTIDPLEKKVLARLHRTNATAVSLLSRRVDAGELNEVLRSLERKGWIETGDWLTRDTVRPLKIKILKAETGTKELTERQRRIWECIAVSQEIPQREITARFPGCGSVLSALERKGWIRTRYREVYRNPFGEEVAMEEAAPELTPDQRAATDEIARSLEAGTYRPFMLYGVTGSGKTEVYLQAVRKALELGRSALVLAPEIGLAAQLEWTFRARFGERLALLHSGLTRGQRFDEWMRILRGEAKVVLGARSAVFAPLRDLGLVVVDEEHDAAYKQEERLRYHARDLAVVRCKLSGAVAVLGSATPSFQTYFNAMQGRYKALMLPTRIGESALPDVLVVDMSEEKRGTRLSRVLVERMSETLNRGEQTILLLNRRGYAPVLLCPACRNVVQCTHCQVALALHGGRGSSGEGRLVCHHCGYTKPFPMNCPVCGFATLIPMGMGTEKLEEHLAERFPDARIARMDRDAVADRRHLFRLLRSLRRGAIDILVGTQMIAKGLDFPGVTLVGVLAADHSLHFPDFAATERTFQLLSQVAGRSGRHRKPGSVIVQTFFPDHYCIEHARRHDFHSFYLQEMKHRKELGYPPYRRLACIGISGTDPLACRDGARAVGERLKSEARNFPGIRILGPAPAPLGRLKGRYRWQILIKGSGTALHRFLRGTWHRCSAWRRLSGLQVTLNVDPVQML